MRNRVKRNKKYENILCLLLLNALAFIASKDINEFLGVNEKGWIIYTPFIITLFISVMYIVGRLFISNLSSRISNKN